MPISRDVNVWSASAVSDHRDLKRGSELLEAVDAIDPEGQVGTWKM